MSDRVFVDTNIFVYADDKAARTKRERTASARPATRQKAGS
jgi:predicted nucleic acid-binding protein